MSQTFTLPPGCRGFTTADGQTLRSSSNGTITLEDNHASRLLRSAHASTGLVSAQSHRLGTKTGRWCVSCSRLWQAWTTRCHRCGELTLLESEVSAAAA
jgi:hypothetical protein